MCRGGFSSLYLHETFCADRLIAATGVVYVGRVVLKEASAIDGEGRDEGGDNGLGSRLGTRRHPCIGRPLGSAKAP